MKAFVLQLWEELENTSERIVILLSYYHPSWRIWDWWRKLRINLARWQSPLSVQSTAHRLKKKWTYCLPDRKRFPSGDSINDLVSDVFQTNTLGVQFFHRLSLPTEDQTNVRQWPLNCQNCRSEPICFFAIILKSLPLFREENWQFQKNANSPSK